METSFVFFSVAWTDTCRERRQNEGKTKSDTTSSFGVNPIFYLVPRPHFPSLYFSPAILSCAQEDKHFVAPHLKWTATFQCEDMEQKVVNISTDKSFYFTSSRHCFSFTALWFVINHPAAHFWQRMANASHNTDKTHQGVKSNSIHPAVAPLQPSTTKPVSRGCFYTQNTQRKVQAK